MVQTLAPATHRDRLAQLRQLLNERALDGLLVNSADEHLNAYLPESRKRRDWLCGFGGSAGDLLVGRSDAWLFVDGRYHEQAAGQIDAALFTLCRLGLEGEPTLVEVLQQLGRAAREQGGRFRLGLDPFTVSVEQWRTFERQLVPLAVELVALESNLVDLARGRLEGVPAPVPSPLTVVPVAVAGQSVTAKLAAVRTALDRRGADLLPITRLDEVAWLFNLRGSDIPHNPVFVAYAIVTASQSFLFCDPERLEAGVGAALPGEVQLLPYERYGETLSALVQQDGSSRVLIDVQRTTAGTLGRLGNCSIIEATHPVTVLKARKNSAEIAGMRQANLQASRAKTRTLYEVLRRFAAGEALSEAQIAALIEQRYREEDAFESLSFTAIAGIGANSSIVHYSTPDPACRLAPSTLLLLDAGAQYRMGTTDDTRTVVAGPPQSEQIARYTAVLKAHINCARQRFPRGTTGAQLDGITRSCLWQAGLDYQHGTGHGVGAFLNVHEGPQGIHKLARESFVPGMVTSIEPGYYLPGWGGIRIENLYVVCEDETDGWYRFEPLTYIPFDAQLIDIARLDEPQRDWLAHYNREVYSRLAPGLDADEGAWLAHQCRHGLTG